MDGDRFDRVVRALTGSRWRRSPFSVLRDLRSPADHYDEGASQDQPIGLMARPASIGTTVPEIVTVVTRFLESPCDSAYNRCVMHAQWEAEQANYRCRLLNYPQNCETSAQRRLAVAITRCDAQYVCARGACEIDRVSGFEPRCCPGQQACGGHCVPSCPPPTMIVLNDATCQCVCDPLLQECELVVGDLQRIRDPQTCQCRCLTDAEAPCQVIGAVRNPGTCVCDCLYPFVPCNGRCVNTQLDARNCGACGIVCGPDQACCDGICTTLTSDEHCGQCFTNLQAPWTCCVAPGRTRGYPRQLGTTTSCRDCDERCDFPSIVCCPPDMTHPTNYCDPGPSAQHCGFCAQAQVCAGREICCQIPGGTKPIQFHCVDPDTSDTDCGRCYNPCAAGRHCDGGTCVCDGNRQACGNLLPSGPAACCNPNANQRCCAGRCATISSDSNNCGGCGIVCHGGQTCVNGACVCPSGRTPCGAGCCPPVAGPANLRDCCSGACVDLQTDRNHCGACPTTCHADRTCVNGACVCPAGRTSCGAGCCPPANGPADRRDCCNATCVNLLTDFQNCGACGTRCQLGQSCCGGRCVNLQNDPHNCGACGWNCGPYTSCSGGSCRCQPGGDCRIRLNYCGPPNTECGCATDVLGNPMCVRPGDCPETACVFNTDCPASRPVCAYNTCCKWPVCAVPCG